MTHYPYNLIALWAIIGFPSGMIFGWWVAGEVKAVGG